MRHLKPIYEFIDTYDFKEELGYYLFEDDFGNMFRVDFDRNNKNKREVSLIYRVKKGNSWSYDMIKTNIYKILKTILDKILKDFIKENTWCDTITMKGLGKDFERDYITQRTKIYNRFLNNNKLEGWDIITFGNVIQLKRIK